MLAQPAAPAAPPFWETLEQALSPLAQRPRLAPGLEFAHHATQAGAAYVVARNPAVGAYLRLERAEFELLGLMDGSRSVQALVLAYFQQQKVLAPMRVLGLVRRLQAQNFLDTPPLDVYARLAERLQARRPETWLLRLAQGFVQARIPYRGADALVGRFYRAAGWLAFTRLGVLAQVVLAVLGPLLIVLTLGQGRINLSSASTPGTAVLIFVLYLLAFLIHELGHALAVKHAGRHIREAGLLVYYGLPAAYVDTTDIWMAPRRMRLITSLAGPWSGMVLAGLAALGAALLPPGPLAVVLFTWAATFSLNNLLNFDPLLELDGYYLLVDLLDKPRLRARALAFVRGPLWRQLWQRQRLTGEERLFALYGLAAGAYSIASLGLAVYFWQTLIWPFVVRAWQTGGPLARLGLLGAALLVGIPLALGLLGQVGQALDWLARQRSLLGRRALALRHRAALAALRAVPLWAEQSEGQLLGAAQAMRLRNVAAGADVVRQGEPGAVFYLIAQGRFEVWRDGERLNTLQRGDYFGELALLHNIPRTATVVAVEPSQVFALDQATFQNTLARDLAARHKLAAALAYRADVAQMPLLQGLSPVELDLLLAHLKPVSVLAGEDVVRQGDVGDRFYVVRSGRLAVYHDGRLVETLGPGRAFGEVALLLRVPRTATVRALEASELLALEADGFHDLLASYLDRSKALEQLSEVNLARIGLGTRKRSPSAATL